MMAEPLSQVEHRPWSLPGGRWAYHQEWLNTVFLHYRVDAGSLAPFLPIDLSPDLFEGSAWVSLVAFDMTNVRPRWAPALPFISNFHEVNLRTYVRYGTMPGVYFLRIDAAKRISAALARMLSVLPYRSSQMSRIHGGDDIHTFYNTSTAGSWSMRYRIGGTITAPTSQDKWLTERYCLYQASKGNLHRYQVHHAPWALRAVELVEAPIIAPLNGITFDSISASHYSPGVRVLSWPSEIVN